jgi:hypothetical protein
MGPRAGLMFWIESLLLLLRNKPHIAQHQDYHYTEMPLKVHVNHDNIGRCVGAIYASRQNRIVLCM